MDDVTNKEESVSSEEEGQENWFEEMLKEKRKKVRAIWIPDLFK